MVLKSVPSSSLAIRHRGTSCRASGTFLILRRWARHTDDTSEAEADDTSPAEADDALLPRRRQTDMYISLLDKQLEISG